MSRALRSLVFVAAAASAVAAETKVRVLRDVAFLAPDRKEKLDVYLPAEAAPGQRRPALVWIHGGGWTGGTKNEARAQNICGAAAEAGYVSVSIDYRLGPGAWPTNLHDCKNAVRFLRARAADYGVDPDRIAVAGGSAGGHLALMVALTAGKPELDPAGDATPYAGVSNAVRCAVNFYGITNILTRQETDKQGNPTGKRRGLEGALSVHRAQAETDPVLVLASPVTHVRRGSPPLLTLHGRADATVDYLQADELDRVARERGAAHQVVYLDGVGHTFHLDQWAKKPLPRDIRPVFFGFLAQHLR